MSPSMSGREEPAIRLPLGSFMKKGKGRSAEKTVERSVQKCAEAAVPDEDHTSDDEVDAIRVGGAPSISNISSTSLSSVASMSDSKRQAIAKAWLKESEIESVVIEEVLDEMEEENEEENAKSGLKSVNVDVLPKKGTDKKEQRSASKALSKSQESVTKKIKQNIEHMKEPNNSQSKVSYYLSKLRNWTDDEHAQYRIEIAENGAIETIIKIMREQLDRKKDHLSIINEEDDSDNHDYGLRLQQLGISCLSNLTREASLSPTIAAAGGYTAIFAAMKHYADSANLQEKGLDAIASMARIESNRAELMKDYSPLIVITGAMTNNLDDVYVQRRACIALFRLSTDDSALEIGNSGVIEEVISSMRHHPKDAKLQNLGCGVLKVLARAEEQNKARIISGRGLSTVLNAMANHEDDSSVQEEACRLFGHLSGCHSERKFSIARAGALEKILKAMKLHPTSAKVQVAGCVALSNLTTKLQIAQMANAHSAVQIVKNAKKDCPEFAPAIIQRLRLARFAPIVFMS